MVAIPRKAKERIELFDLSSRVVVASIEVDRECKLSVQAKGRIEIRRLSADGRVKKRFGQY